MEIKDLTVEQISRLLEDIPEEKWHRHEWLVKEGVNAWIDLMVSSKKNRKKKERKR